MTSLDSGGQRSRSQQVVEVAKASTSIDAAASIKSRYLVNLFIHLFIEYVSLFYGCVTTANSPM